MTLLITAPLASIVTTLSFATLLLSIGALPDDQSSTVHLL